MHPDRATVSNAASEGGFKEVQKAFDLIMKNRAARAQGSPAVEVRQSCCMEVMPPGGVRERGRGATSMQ